MLKTSQFPRVREFTSRINYIFWSDSQQIT